jgi:hypothetical protein
MIFNTRVQKLGLTSSYRKQSIAAINLSLSFLCSGTWLDRPVVQSLTVSLPTLSFIVVAAEPNLLTLRVRTVISMLINTVNC